jgi:hypothetical protein
MGYIITVTIPDHAMNRDEGVRQLLTDPLIRLLREDDGETVLDMRGDYDRNAEQVRWLCGKLIDAGVLEFDIGHSY